MQQAGDFFIKLRGEMNRSKQELDQAIKDKEPESELAQLRQEAEQKKMALYRALDATIEHADDAVLDNLGGHQKLILSLVNALIMCIKSSDFSGKLPKIILELFTHFPMTKKIAETANFETVRKRFADKGDQEVKGLVAEITAKVKKIHKTAEPETSTGYAGTSAASRAKAGPKASADHPTKRGRDDEADQRTVKKIAVESSGNSLSRKLAQPKIQLQAASKVSAAKAAAASALAAKSRPITKAVPKTEATKVDGKTARVESKPIVPRTAATSASSALGGIASLLNSINAPKAEAPVVSKETKGNEISETPEEKTKRLRKEARRKLRVTWKPESELVQVKIFQKEEAEDDGRLGNMIRDAGDDRSEGMVLKQRADVEEDDDDDDVPYQPWVGPVALEAGLPEETRNKNYVTRGGNVMFTTDEQHHIAEREQRELMAIYTDVDDIPPTPKSPPKEPAANPDWTKSHLPGDAKFQEIQLRWRDEQQMGVDGALYSALKRLDAKENPSNRLDTILDRLRGVPSTPQVTAQVATPTQQSINPAHERLPLISDAAVQEQLLAILRSEQVKTWQGTNPNAGDVWRAFHYADHNVRLCGGSIETVAKSLADKPFPATSPPEWILHDQEKVREWQMGYQKELIARRKREDEDRARTAAQANAPTVGQMPANNQDWTAYYAQQPAYAPYMALLQQVTGAQQPAQQPAQQLANTAQPQQSQIPDTQLQSILAAINQPSQQPPQAQASNPPNFLNPNDPAYQQYMMFTQMAQGQQAPPPPPPQPSGNRDWEREHERDNNQDRDWDRDRNRDRDWDRDRTYDHDRDRDDYQGGRGDFKRKRGTLPPHKPANKALIGTKPCTFWQQGKCARGDKCTFRHD